MNTAAVLPDRLPDPGEVDGLLAVEQVMARTGLSRSGLARRVERGDFPRAGYRCGNRMLWDREVVEDWLKRAPHRRVVALTGHVR